MKKTNKNKIPDNSFLKDDPNKEGISKEHQDYLGYKIPANYFTESKNDILNSLSSIDEPIMNINRSRSIITWVAAASAALLIVSATYFFLTDSSVFNNNALTEEYSGFDENNIILNSFFVDDSDLDEYIENYIMEDIITESELETDNVIINSLLMDDSTADDYIDDYLIEKLIL